MSTIDWINYSFVLSIITNIVVFFGVFSLIYWVSEEKIPWVARHKNAFEFVIAMLYSVYLTLLSVENTHFNSPILGMHWSSLNLLIISGFIFNVFISTKAQFAYSSITTILYGFMFATQNYLATSALCAVLIGMQYLLMKQSYKYWSRRRIMYPFFAVYAFIALFAVWLLAPSTTDAGFWFRQISALVLTGLCSYEYVQMLLRRGITMRYERKMRRTDELTRTLNFGAFNEDLQKLFVEHQAKGTMFAIFELDIDWFKNVNDRYGHIVGNEVLRRVGAEMLAIMPEISPTTQVYRLGGEEFGLVVKDFETNPECAREVSRQLRKRIGELDFVANGERFKVTVSLGQERVREGDRNYLDVYQRVDRFLYEAKRAGRDRINVQGRMSN